MIIDLKNKFDNNSMHKRTLIPVAIDGHINWIP